MTDIVVYNKNNKEIETFSPSAEWWSTAYNSALNIPDNIYTWFMRYPRFVQDLAQNHRVNIDPMNQGYVINLMVQHPIIAFVATVFFVWLTVVAFLGYCKRIVQEAFFDRRARELRLAQRSTTAALVGQGLSSPSQSGSISLAIHDRRVEEKASSLAPLAKEDAARLNRADILPALLKTGAYGDPSDDVKYSWNSELNCMILRRTPSIHWWAVLGKTVEVIWNSLGMSAFTFWIIWIMAGSLSGVLGPTLMAGFGPISTLIIPLIPALFYIGLTAWHWRRRYCGGKPSVLECSMADALTDACRAKMAERPEAVSASTLVPGKVDKKIFLRTLGAGFVSVCGAPCLLQYIFWYLSSAFPVFFGNALVVSIAAWTLLAFALVLGIYGTYKKYCDITNDPLDSVPLTLEEQDKYAKMRERKAALQAADNSRLQTGIFYVLGSDVFSFSCVYMASIFAVRLLLFPGTSPFMVGVPLLGQFVSVLSSPLTLALIFGVGALIAILRFSISKVEESAREKRDFLALKEQLIGIEEEEKLLSEHQKDVEKTEAATPWVSMATVSKCTWGLFGDTAPVVGRDFVAPVIKDEASSGYRLMQS